jgi:zinc transport system substrate-binding protein
MLQGIGALAGMVALGAPGRAFAAGSGDVVRAVASNKPNHSLLAGVMAGIGEPALLVQGHASPHSYSLKPSDAALLEEADLVFWVGEPVETFLERPLAALGGRAEVIELLETDGVSLLASRGGGLWEPHRHEGAAEADEAVEAEAHGHGLDGHIWLDPANAKAIVARMAGALALHDPAHASRYSDNAAQLRARIDALDREMTTWLAPVRDKPFIVFHDAYQYLEAHFGLNAMGSITVNPEQSPSAERLAEIQAKIAGIGAVCDFAEPQFSEALVRTATEGSTARSGTLDPEATDIPPGPDLYFVLMRNLARSLVMCLMK